MTNKNTFLDFDLSTPTISALKDMRYTQPTAVQQESIPLAMSGRDLVVQARTGTGKTAAFGIPLVEKVDANTANIQAMVLTPTRELTAQVCDELGRIGSGHQLRVQAVYGGNSIQKQIDSIRSGVQIIVGTPGRVLDLLKRKILELSSVQSLVLDEADRMLDMGFAQEMSEIMTFVPAKRQTSLYSATVPIGIRGIIHNYLRNPKWISLSEDFAYVREVKHSYIMSPTADKERVLFNLIELDQPTASMIFCNTRSEVRSVSTYLTQKGLPVEMISSDLTQKKRESVMSLFRSGKIRHLVATDVAARGIDIDELSHVFIYSTPDSPEDYIHRAGRTGRSGSGGDVVSLVSATDLVSFNRLENQYQLQLIERDTPSSEEISRRRNERLLQQLLLKATESKNSVESEFNSLTNQLLASPERTNLINYLLHKYYKNDLENEGTKSNGMKRKNPSSSKKKNKRKHHTRSRNTN